MGWLEQIKTRRTRRKDEPDRGRTVFSDYEFTDDRRERARRAREEEGQEASNLFSNARRERVNPVTAAVQQKARPVHFEGDERDADEKPEKRSAPRRSAKRIRTPIRLYYFPTPEHFVPLELTVISRDGRPKAVDCFLYDVNDSGIGFAAPERFPEDSELTILGVHAEDLDPLIATDVTIVNSRPFPDGKPIPEKFADRALWLHGTRMEIQDALLLYKATLDSIALQVALAEAGEEEIHSPEADAPDDTPAPGSDHEREADS